jgi:hypothetical protein
MTRLLRSLRLAATFGVILFITFLVGGALTVMIYPLIVSFLSIPHMLYYMAGLFGLIGAIIGFLVEWKS